METFLKLAIPGLIGAWFYARPFLWDSEVRNKNWIEFLGVAGILLFLVFMLAFSFTRNQKLFFYFALIGWGMVIGVSFVILDGIFRMLAANEGISFFMIGRVCFHAVILILVLKTWGAYAGMTPTAEFSGASQSNRLIFVLHGFGGPRSVDSLNDYMQNVVFRDDKVVPISYLMGTESRTLNLLLPMSNKPGNDVVEGIESEIRRVFKENGNPAAEVILVGHSAGAVLARKVFLHGSQRCSDRVLSQTYENPPQAREWAQNVKRIVLLSGINRGLDITGDRPSDMSAPKHFGMWLGAFAADLTGGAKFAMEFESGTPFIANLRYDWVDCFAGAKEDRPRIENPPMVVQVRGDIDEIVGEEDSHDVATMIGPFKSLTVNGTGHQDLVHLRNRRSEEKSGTARKEEDVSNQRRSAISESNAGQHDMPDQLNRNDAQQIALYRHRESVIKEALTAEFVADESQKCKSVDDVDKVVIVLHGIRDYGRWSVQFREKLERDANTDSESGKTVVVNPRYGYFGMGPFLFGSEREKHVKWFMDEITERKAEFPNAKFDFVGHSNGTYLLAKALQEYDALDLSTVVFAGSVVNRSMDWQSYRDSQRVETVLNIKADNDWVVALFPQVFEYIRSFYYLLPFKFRQPIGSAGYSGFDQEEAVNQITIKGGHSAFRKIIPEISEYIDDLDLTKLNNGTINVRSNDESRWKRSLCIPVFLAIAAVVILLGVWFVSPGRQYSAQVGIVYVALVVWLLQRL